MGIWQSRAAYRAYTGAFHDFSSPGRQIRPMEFPMFIRIAAGAALASIILSTGTSAAPPQTAQQPTIQQQNEEMIKELRAIRQLLERLTEPQGAPQPQVAKVSNLGGYSLGRPDAPLTMVEFTDLQCPYCRQFATTTFDELKRNWIDTGRLRYVSRDFPLEFHQQAMRAAKAARCSGEQGKFWEMRWALMRNANLLSPAFITKTASDLKLDADTFAACTASTRFDAAIQADMLEAVNVGVTGTPTFVVGRTTASGIEGPVIVGALEYAKFDARLKQALAK
jgi:protein-disulfide isomerase